MAGKAGTGCLGWLVAGGLLLALIGQCATDPPSPSEIRPQAVRIETWRYVRPAAANCRSQASTRAVALDRLERNDFVGVVRSEAGWSLIDRATDCWVRDDLLSEGRIAAPAPAQRFSGEAARSQASRRPGAGVYYANCSAARAAGAAPVYRGEPGYASRLDRDGDGVGCE